MPYSYVVDTYPLAHQLLRASCGQHRDGRVRGERLVGSLSPALSRDADPGLFRVTAIAQGDSMLLAKLNSSMGMIDLISKLAAPERQRILVKT